jgi:hypothetical protein
MYVDTWVSLNVWFNIVMDIFSFDIVWEKLTGRTGLKNATHFYPDSGHCVKKISHCNI